MDNNDNNDNNNSNNNNTTNNNICIYTAHDYPINYIPFHPIAYLFYGHLFPVNDGFVVPMPGI